MNLLHLKYAIEVAETGSINRAAEKLYVGQPNLSRAIKELETSLGVTLFCRSAKGMELTSDGEVFIRYAKNILTQVDEVEGLFRKGTVSKKRFTLSAPRASYVADALARFSCALRAETDLEIFYRETNSVQTLKDVLEEDYRIGILRYAAPYDPQYRAMLEEKGLAYEPLADFRYLLLMSRESPLATRECVTFDDLRDRIEVTHADPLVPSLPYSVPKKQEPPEEPRRRIFVFERASQFELLSRNVDTFMWVSPLSSELLERYGLVQRPCGENNRVCKDILIHKKEYTLSPLDRLFVSELCRSKREIFRQDLT